MTEEHLNGDALDAADAGSRVARGGAYRLGAYAAGTGFSLLGIVFVTRALGPERFGDFQAVMNLITVVAAVTDVGLTTLGVREYSQRDAVGRGAFLRTLLGLRIVLTLLGAGVAVAIVAAQGADSDLLLGTVCMGLALGLTVIQSTWTIPLFGDLRLFAVAALDALRQVLLAGAFIVLALAGSGTLGFLAAAVPVQVLVAAATIAVVGVGSRHGVSLLPSIDVSAWRVLLGASLGFATAMGVGTLYQYVAQLLSVFVVEAQAAGAFAVAFRTYIVLCAVPGLIVSGAFPVLSRRAVGDDQRFDAAIRVLSEATVILGVALGIGVVVGAPFIIEVVGGDAYRDAVPAMRILGVALVLASVITTWGSSLFAAHRHTAIVTSNLVALAVVVSGVFASGPSGGATGIAIAVLAAELILAVGYGTALLGRHPAARPALAATGVTVGLGIALTIGGLLAPGPSVVLAIAAVAIFAVCVGLARVLPAEVADLIPPPFRRVVRSR